MLPNTARERSLLAKHAHDLTYAPSAYGPLIAAIGDAQVVLIGDGSHGTYEFYAHRANLTKQLIEEKGFTALAVEADWPDAFRVNRYIHGGAVRDGKIKSARDSLRDFERFPKWMWKNEVMPPFIDFLKQHNARVSNPTQKVSFYGLDLYSLHRSADRVIEYLEKVDPEGAKAARKRYNCFERFGEDTTRYAYETQFGLSKDCHKEVIANLRSLLLNRQKFLEQEMPDWGEDHPGDAQFVAEMNALVVRDAEEYYRTMMTEDVLSWNLRDDHFARVVASVSERLATRNSDGSIRRGKIVVWAHNSHVGDARHTDMGRRRGEVNVGQRCREIFGEGNVFNIGFLTNLGTVTASHDWDEPPFLQKMNLPIDGSLERVFHDCAMSDCYVITQNVIKDVNGKTKKREVSEQLSDFLNRPRPQRFIGVIYRRRTEVPSHYFGCSAANQYDAIVHVRESRGITPLEPEDISKEQKPELDLTFPFGY